MKYQTVFEITENGSYPFWFVVPGLIGILIIAFYYKIFKNTRKGLFGKPLIKFLFIFLVFWFIITSYSTFSKQFTMRRNYRNGDFDVVEGVVENFDPMPVFGHKRESFTVNDVKFEYSDYVISPGFNNAASKGGPIKENLPVRISHKGNVILKLEIGVTDHADIVSDSQVDTVK